MDLEPIIYSDEDLEPVEVPVRLGKRDYLLVEADEAAAARWESLKLRGGVVNEDGSVTLPDDPDRAGNLRRLLVTACLREVYIKNGDDNQPQRMTRPVSEAFVKTLKPFMVAELFDRAKRISRIDQDYSREFLERWIPQLQETLGRLKRGNASKNL